MRLLLLSALVPWPPVGGSRARLWHLFRHVARRHELHVLALQPPGEPVAARPADWPFASYEVAPIPGSSPPRLSPGWWSLRVRSLRHPAAAWYQPDVAERLRALAARIRPDAVVYGMSAVLPYARHLPGLRAIADEHNYDPLITRRMAASRRGLDRLKWDAYAAITERAERRNLLPVQGIAACSEEDAAAFRAAAPHAHVALVPNAVDTSAFTPGPPGDAAVMTGSFTYGPNVDGAHRLVTRIWPIVRRSLPDARLRIAGLRSEETLRDLAGEPGVTVAGTVDDMRAELAAARVAVAPLDVGGGTRIKILEAFAAGRAVVSTRVGAEGLDVRDGENILLRDDDQGFADAMIAVLRDPSLAASLGAKGRALAEARYDWSQSAAAFEALLQRVTA